MEQLLSVLYGVSGIAASALYVPQIIKYRRDQDACKSISLLTWGGWIAVSAVTIIYALFVLRNYLVATVAVTSTVAQVAVLFYAINARLSKRCSLLSDSGAGVADTIAYPSKQKIEIGSMSN
jgi:hypothetical protein